jgi:hypothetical protein
MAAHRKSDLPPRENLDVILSLSKDEQCRFAAR